MSAAGARAWKVVKPHVPLIKFRKGGHALGISTEPILSSVSQPQGVPAPSTSPPVGSLPRGSGIDESELPPRYARKPITQIEMDYIERGGPE